MNATSVGPLLRAWRTSRGKSQLALALEAGVSTRHLSFVETGRSSPSREMVLALAETLDVPLRERNALLEAAGFAAVYHETPLDAPALADARAALDRILEAHAPNPALVVNRRYDILLANDAATRLLSHFAPEYRGKGNVLAMLLDETGLRRTITNWGEVTTHVAHRVRTELAARRTRSIEDEAILARIHDADSALRAASATTKPPAILVPLRFHRGDRSLDLFTMITTLGTPLDITLQELRIETLFPANARSREALAEIVTA